MDNWALSEWKRHKNEHAVMQWANQRGTCFANEVHQRCIVRTAGVPASRYTV